MGFRPEPDTKSDAQAVELDLKIEINYETTSIQGLYLLRNSIAYSCWCITAFTESLFMMISGQVHHAAGRGKKLGFPTANLAVTEPIEDGIYVAYCVIETAKYPALAFFGAAVTFGETEKQFEVYILDYAKDLYDKNITGELLQKLRDNIKFETSEELIKQMQADERHARDYFMRLNK